ncbi:SIMPL domain-containing protein [Xanthobacter sp. V4C-4]|uniref:SIMPL domain-containing protein n=1 Tax=Xanthobacter cornucopiae TaxID=3119924 RepID=UPI003726345B
MFAPLHAAAAFAFVSLAAPAALAATITVAGEARISVVPDAAVLTTGVVSAGKTADEALAANSKAVSALIETIKAAGVEPRDIATSSFSLQPQYATGQGAQREAPRLVGFEVRNSVRVTVRDLAALGPLLDKMVQAGANQASGLAFTVSNRAKLEQDARVAAVKDAMDQAAVVAGAAGLRLVRIVSITPEADGSGPIMPVPMFAKADAARMAVPVEAGEVEVRGRASIVYDAEPQ